MTSAPRAAPVLFVAVWFVVVVTGLALAALKATEPPAWDALSYLQKAFTFWQAVDAGKPFNPFNLPLTMRPPGTILLSYPLGWSEDFRWFYFRSSAIPCGLFIVAICVAGWPSVSSTRDRWMLAALAVALAGMPILFQFQYTTDRWPATWGLVDAFLAGIAAFAVAAAMRSAATRSIGWATAAAAAAGALCLFIKPSGLLLMALTGATWLIVAGFGRGWTMTRLKQEAAERRFLVVSVAIAVVIFAAAVAAAFGSAYFSRQNIVFGQRVLVLFDGEFSTRVSILGALRLVLDAFGYAIPLMTIVGFFAAWRAWGPVLAATLCLLSGLWFWLFETELAQIRYFLPFGVMAFIFLIPALIIWMRARAPVTAYAGAALMAAPTLVTTALLFMPAPPLALQSALGINLESNAFGPENAQGVDFLRRLQADGIARTSLYVADATPTLRNFLAVASYATIAAPTQPQVSILTPVDWQNPSAMRMESMLHSDFIAFEPVKNEAQRSAILSQTDVPHFAAETLLLNAWLTELTETEGITVISETRVRLVRVVDHERFDAALERLATSHTWPQSHRTANPQRWWSAEDIAARRQNQPMPAVDVAFYRTGETDPALWVRHVETEAMPNGSLQVRLWIEAGPGALEDTWRVFGHLMSADGRYVDNNEVHLVADTSPTPAKPIRYYTMTYAAPPADAATLAFGILRPNGQSMDFLTAPQGPTDWDGRRLIVPLAASR